MADRTNLRERKKQQTRERLMAAAIRLFRDRGYDGATVELIADEADVSVTTFFRYFDSKQDVFLASFRSVWDRFERAVRDRPAGVPVLQAVRGILIEIVPELSPPRERAALKTFHTIPELHDRLREYEEGPARVLTEAFADDLGVEPTDLRPQLLVGAVMGALGAARTAWFADPSTPILEHLLQALDLVEEMAEPILHPPR